LNAFVAVDFTGEIHPPLIATFCHGSIGKLDHIPERMKAICGIKYFRLFGD